MKKFTKAQLIDFRDRLIWARELCRDIEFGPWLSFECSQAGLNELCEGATSIGTVPLSIFEWYCVNWRTPAEREAMWDNSIAHVEKRIARMK